MANPDYIITNRPVNEGPASMKNIGDILISVPVSTQEGTTMHLSDVPNRLSKVYEKLTELPAENEDKQLGQIVCEATPDEILAWMRSLKNSK